MVGVILYTLVELLNFYLAYRIVFGIRFTERKTAYAIVVSISCIVQATVYYLAGDGLRDMVAVAMGLFCALILTKSRRSKIGLLYPIIFMLTSVINLLGSCVVAAVLGMTQKTVIESTALTLLSECTAIICFLWYSIVNKKDKREERSLTVGQYLILLVGCFCFFVIIGFVQGVAQGAMKTVSQMKDLTVAASVAIALVFMILSIWQQHTWKKAAEYRMENEKYEMFLEGQEKYIRTLIIEDEKRRKLRHDMNAHMLALETMIEKEEWELLKAYLGQMHDSLQEASVEKYTGISAVDAIVDKYYKRAVEHNVEWYWEGRIQLTDHVSIFELCTLFSNLLSNATEAVEKVEGERKIEIKIAEFQERIVLTVQNSCREKQVSHERPVTTKHDKINHGLGLMNVEEIVQKHKGSIEYETNNGRFQVVIVL